MSWASAQRLERAIENLRVETKGDWYRDPWGWPEYDYLLDSGLLTVRARLKDQSPPRAVAEIDVPKENFGTRPAVVLDILDRITYQLLIDHMSRDLVGRLSRQAFGWRLPPTARGLGKYSRQDFQWEVYRTELNHLSGIFDAALKTDIASFFSSIRVDQLMNQVADRVGDALVVDRLHALLAGWDAGPSRTGLPQRSTASSILANMFLSPVDEILRSHSSTFGMRLNGSQLKSHVRWMDDMWLFSNDVAKIRGAQVDLESAVRELRLVLNSGKTKVLEGAALQEVARKIQHSAVDEALLESPMDEHPLEELIDEILEDPETVDRTTVRFVTTRMRRHHVDYRIHDLIDASAKMPHAADSLSRLFRAKLHGSEIQDWFLDFDKSDWNCFEWTWAQFGTALTSRRSPRRSVRSLFEERISTPGVSLPALALAAHRVAAWDSSSARGLIAGRMEGENCPHARRVLSLAALHAGETPRHVRRWLRQRNENSVTLAMLEANGFTGAPVARDYI